METTLAASSSRADDPLRVEVATLFSVFQRLFAQRWDRNFNDPHARGTWLAALRQARVTPADVKRGMAAASQLRWPPTSGEFIELCRPEAPDLAIALHEAQLWARGELAQWSHPAIGDAARRMGSLKLRRLQESEIRTGFGDLYAGALSRFHRGESLEVPPVLSLPKPKRQRAPADSPVVAAEIEKLSRLLGTAS